MNSRVLVLLAVLLLVGASIAGYLGYRTTVEAREAVAAAEKRAAESAAATGTINGRTSVMVVIKPVPAFKVLTKDDVAVDHLKVPPPNSFRKPADIIGQAPQVDLEPGTVLDRSHINPGGEIARLLRPGERAVAIPVDDVVGGGGFVQPGDVVDILLYLSALDGSKESAQVVMRSVRVLSFGIDLINPAGGTKKEEDDSGSNRRGARTAVLAIAKSDVTRLMLANSLGTLRLAIVPTAEIMQSAQPQTAGAGGPLPAVVVEQTQSKPSAVPEQKQFLTSSVLKGTPPPALRRRATVSSKGPVDPPVIIYRGLNSQVAP